MEFGPSETQRLFVRFLRDYLSDRLPADELQRLARLGSGFDQTLWGGLAELGLTGVLVPEAHGGTGLGMFEAALAAEALGYFAAPAPFTGAAVMAPLAIGRSGSAVQQVAWLPRIAAGTARFAVVFERGGDVGAGAAVDRRRDRLSGRLAGGLDLGGATHVLAVLGDGALAILGADDPGVRVATLPSLDATRPVGEV
jgi:alkylation response protein AidB-like acyl-CoA dehydrogenase